jgi:flagellar biosynthesis protein FlhG
MARIITITSEKERVGKTSISLNLSLSLASKGFKVCLFDSNISLSNVNILTNIYPGKNIESVILRQSRLKDIIIKNYHGIDIIPGSIGIKNLANLTQAQSHNLVNAFFDLEDYDYFILDTSEGMTPQVLSFCMASHEIILVATCESTSLTHAYTMLKKLSKYHYDFPVKVLINQAKSGKAAKKAYDQLKELVNKFLSIKIEPLGIVASDKNVRASVVSQTPFFILFPNTIASKCINSITGKLLSKSDVAQAMPLEFFWDKCLSFLKKHHQPKQVPAPLPEPVVNKNKEKDQDIKKTLAHIESRISLLTKEVSDIKKFLKAPKDRPYKSKEKAPKSLKPPELTAINFMDSQKSKEKAPKPAEPKEITLDFESWLKKKYK